MRAIVFDGLLAFHSDAPEPILPPQTGHEQFVIVDVLMAGICETDLQLCKGYMGFRGTLGHEFVGIARTGRLAGQRVVGEINCACHQCEMCRQGNTSHCPHRTVIGILNHDGAFADRLVVPDRNLHALPEHVTNVQAVFVEPLAAACRIPEQLSVQGDERVTVLGDGRLGNLCAQVMRHHGCHVTVFGKHEFKLKILQEMGISACLRSNSPANRTADIVIDCTGSPTGLEDAIRMVRPCGTIVLKTTVAAAQTMHMAPLVIDEIRVVGSRCGPFSEAIRLLSAGSVTVDTLVSASYPLEDAETAFQHAIRKDALKVLFEVRR